jgi:hypothetical protein
LNLERILEVFVVVCVGVELYGNFGEVGESCRMEVVEVVVKEVLRCVESGRGGALGSVM